MMLKTTESGDKYVSVALGNSYPVTVEQAAIIDAVLNDMGSKFGLTAVAIWLWNGRPENDWVAVFCTAQSCQIVAGVKALQDSAWQELIVDAGWARQ